MNDDPGALPADPSLPAEARSAQARGAGRATRLGRPAPEHPVHRVAGPGQPAGRGIRGAGRPAGLRPGGPRPPRDAAVRRAGRRTAVPGAAQRRHLLPVPPRAPGLPAELPGRRPDRRGLQRDALPGAALVPATGDLPGEPRAHRAVADPVPPAGLHRGPAHREHGHALGAPREPVPHRVPLHRGVAGDDGRRTRPDPADLQRRRPARPADATLAGPAVPGARPARRLQAPRPAAAAVGPGAARDRRAAGDRRRRAGASAAGGAGRTRRGVHRPGVGAGEAPADVLGVAAGASGADRGLGHRGRRGGDPRYPGGSIRRAGAARLGGARRDRDAGARPRASLPRPGPRWRSTAGGARRSARRPAPGRCSCTGRPRSKGSPRSPTRPSSEPGGSHHGGDGPGAGQRGGQGAANAPGNPLQAFYENPGVPLSSGPDRARRQARMLAGILRDCSTGQR